MRALVAILFLLTSLAQARPAIATPVTTTFGGTGTSGSTSGRAKLNIYNVTTTATLQTISAWAGASGTTSVTFGIWQQNSSTSTSWTSVWQQSLSISGGNAWRSVNPNFLLQAGTRYAIGIHFVGTVTYQYSSTSALNTAAWGGQVDWEDYAAASYPATLTSVTYTGAVGGYYQQLTVDVDLDSDNDGYDSGVDCDDTNPLIHPGAAEVCNGLDDDCDGSIPTSEEDWDFDGVIYCAGDCDDQNATVFPGAAELCDSLDNDCDTAIDEGLTFDGDADGHSSTVSCQGTQDDCDDADATVYPGAPETCDGVDDDCDFSIDDGLSTDADFDGYSAPGSCLGGANDCDDANPNANPGMVEVCDGIDNDCVGGTPGDEADADADNYRVCEGDCADLDASRNPGMAEDCENGIDDNCNGETDEAIDLDGDGFNTCEDCNDNDSAIYPGATEDDCSGLDEDCDGALLPSERDEDGDGFMGCEGDCDDAVATVYPGAEEVCDGFDNNCDGAFHPEEGPENDVDGDGFAQCGDCDDEDADIYPGAAEDECDDADMNCDGVTPSGDDCEGGGGGGGGSRRGCACDLSSDAAPLLAPALLIAVPLLRRRGRIPG